MSRHIKNLQYTIFLILIFNVVGGVKFSSKYSEFQLQRKRFETSNFDNTTYNKKYTKPPHVHSTLINQKENVSTVHKKDLNAQTNKYKITLDNKDESVQNDSYSIENVWPVRIFNCVGSNGIMKCLKVFLIRRMNRVVETLKNQDKNKNVTIEFDLQSEVEQDFKWEDYKKVSEKEIDKTILKNLKGLVDNKKMRLVMSPGINIDVFPASNGSITFNIKKDPELSLPRGMKFPKKMFYRIVPVLLIPPLIMSAILPFVLPAMKMMIIGVGMLNQMALMGAIFTLLRNNAFSENTYHKKVIYVNDGYKNEKKPPPIVYHDHLQHNLHHQHPKHNHFDFPQGHSHGGGFPDIKSPAFEEEHQEVEDEVEHHGHFGHKFAQNNWQHQPEFQSNSQRFPAYHEEDDDDERRRRVGGLGYKHSKISGY